MNEKKPQNEDLIIKSEEDIAKMKEQVKQEVIEDNSPNEEQKKLFEKALEEATMPVSMTDKDFKLGDNELDIRNLSKKNKDQMFFRQNVIMIATLRQCMTSLVDLERLIMVVADKLGVEDIIGATDDIIEKVSKQRKELKEIIEKKKDSNDA